jgi:hypothetical protein
MMSPRPAFPQPARRRLLWAAVLAACTSAAAQQPPPTAPDRRSERMVTPSASSAGLCIGRFRLELPEGWALTGREQKIYRSSVTDELRGLGPAVPGLSATQRVLRGDLPTSDPVIREFTLDGVGPAAWFALGSPSSPSRRLVVLAGTPEAGLRLEALATVGREAQAEEGLRQLAAGYRPGQRTGFFLPNGAFAVEPGRNETTRLLAEHPRLPGASLRFSTAATTAPRSDGPLADPAADAQAMAGSGSSLKPLGQTERLVAGHKGRDARAELSEPAKPPTLVYRFFFAGIAANAAAPEILIALDGPVSARPALDAAWNQLLDSVRPVPLR